jgi:hypothetical protein
VKDDFGIYPFLTGLKIITPPTITCKINLKQKVVIHASFGTSLINDLQTLTFTIVNNSVSFGAILAYFKHKSYKAFLLGKNGPKSPYFRGKF